MQGLNAKVEITETKDIALKVTNIINKLQFANEDDKEYSLSSYIFYLLKAAESSDQKLRAEIENNIIKLGVKAVPYLIDSLMTIKGASRGLAAMALIRIGFESIEFLTKTAEANPDFGWVADYIIAEIHGTKVPLTA